MAKLKVDKGIPVPMSRKGDYEGLAETIKQMEVGDSFFVDDLRDSFRGNCYWQAKFAQIKVTVRRVREDNVEGVRVWRIAATEEKE